MTEKKKKVIKRVSDSHLQLSPELIDKPLATPIRRALAMIIDVLTSFIVFIPIMIIITAIVVFFRSPDVYEYIRLINQDLSETEEQEANTQFYINTIHKINRTMPEKLPLVFRNALNVRDDTKLRALVEEYDWEIMIAFSNEPLTRFDEFEKHAQVGLYPFLGKISFLFNFGGVLIFYFTLVTWRSNGYTLGKRLFKVRICRINGKKLSLWHAFDRAGGYTASLATFGLGFIEMLWTENRQCIHDRISGTVVICMKKESNSEIEMSSSFTDQ